MNEEIKQVIIVREDLKMSIGKIGAQCGHGVMKVYFDRMKLYGFCDSDWPQPRGCNVDEFTKPMRDWIDYQEGDEGFTKIVCECWSEEELRDLYNQAKKAKLPCSIILDSGLTELKEDCPDCSGYGHNLKTSGPENQCKRCNGTGNIPKPAYTVAVIGPAYKSEVDAITGKLKLLRRWK